MVVTSHLAPFSLLPCWVLFQSWSESLYLSFSKDKSLYLPPFPIACFFCSHCSSSLHWLKCSSNFCPQLMCTSCIYEPFYCTLLILLCLLTQPKWRKVPPGKMKSMSFVLSLKKQKNCSFIFYDMARPQTSSFIPTFWPIRY